MGGRPEAPSWKRLNDGSVEMTVSVYLDPSDKKMSVRIPYTFSAEEWAHVEAFVSRGGPVASNVDAFRRLHQGLGPRQ